MTDRELEYAASDLAHEASDLRDEPAAAERKLREAAALLARVATISDYGRIVAANVEESLADVLIDLGSFEEAERVLEKLRARAKTPRESISALAAHAELEERRGDSGAAERWLREAGEIAHAGGVRLRDRALAMDERLASIVRSLGRIGEAGEIDARIAAARMDLLRDYFRHDPRPLVERVRTGPFPMRADEVRMLSHGMITSAETFRDGKPVLGGLRCAKIFGPLTDYECICEKYRGEQHAGIVCEECLVEVIRSEVRAFRPAHINLPSPVIHPPFKSAVVAAMGMSERQFLALPDRDSRWRFDTFETHDRKTADLVALLNETGLEREGMVIECLPVLPPEGPLPIDRELLDHAYGSVFAAEDDPQKIQRAVNRLFALFR